MEMNQKIVLASRPAAWVEESNFRLEECDIPQPGVNQVLVRNQWLSLDPYMRGRMSDARSYAAPVAIGDVMIGGTAGEVVQSNHPDFAPGDKVVGALGWQLFGVADGNALQKVDASVIHLSAWLGPLGMPGVTAWVGLFDICAPRPGDTVVVTAASGAVGSVVGQLAKIHGARAIGIAGGADKCRYVADELGFDACIDYKAGNLRGDLKAAAPAGIDCLFENVGGEIFDTLLTQMKPFSRIALCGLISQYNTAPWPLQEHRRGVDESHQDAGLHRLRRPEPLAAGPEGTGRPRRDGTHQVSREHRRRTRRRAGRPHQPAEGRQLRQAVGKAVKAKSICHRVHREHREKRNAYLTRHYAALYESLVFSVTSVSSVAKGFLSRHHDGASK